MTGRDRRTVVGTAEEAAAHEVGIVYAARDGGTWRLFTLTPRRDGSYTFVFVRVLHDCMFRKQFPLALSA